MIKINELNDKEKSREWDKMMREESFDDEIEQLMKKK